MEEGRMGRYIISSRGRDQKPGNAKRLIGRRVVRNMTGIG
jgi:hypothetical protein